jgi:hypothetical protein
MGDSWYVPDPTNRSVHSRTGAHVRWRDLEVEVENRAVGDGGIPVRNDPAGLIEVHVQRAGSGATDVLRCRPDQVDGRRRDRRRHQPTSHLQPGGLSEEALGADLSREMGSAVRETRGAGGQAQCGSRKGRGEYGGRRIDRDPATAFPVRAVFADRELFEEGDELVGTGRAVRRILRHAVRDERA